MCDAESLSTLKFANRAKNIRNAARVNEDVDQRTLLRKYERELRRLRAELQQRQRELVDKRHLLEVCLLEHFCSGLLAGYCVVMSLLPCVWQLGTRGTCLRSAFSNTPAQACWLAKALQSLSLFCIWQQTSLGVPKPAWAWHWFDSFM